MAAAGRAGLGRAGRYSSEVQQPLAPSGTTHAEQDTVIGDYIRWRNQRVKPKSGFAAGSKIRHPDYPFKPA